MPRCADIPIFQVPKACSIASAIAVACFSVSALDSAQRDLNGTGRVVVRYSGTEALARVMIEAESSALTEKHATAIAEAIEHALGT